MKLKKSAVFLILVLFLALSCRGPEQRTAVDTPMETAAPAPTEVAVAVRVNGAVIPLTEYEAEMKRYQAAEEQLGEAYDPVQAREDVLDMLIAHALFAQAAYGQGYALDENDVQVRIDGYIQLHGGQGEFDAWLADNFYDMESFRAAVARDLAAIWARNALLDQVPNTADQVHARQILVDSENEAVGVQRQLEVGTPFRDLAFQYDPLTGGDLGWFPSGYLLQPDVEAAAFALQPGEFSAIIPTSYGYHLVEVIARDAERPLSRDALLFVQRRELEKWLENQIAVGEIEILVS